MDIQLGHPKPRMVPVAVICEWGHEFDPDVIAHCLKEMDELARILSQDWQKAVLGRVVVDPGGKDWRAFCENAEDVKTPGIETLCVNDEFDLLTKAECPVFGPLPSTHLKSGEDKAAKVAALGGELTQEQREEQHDEMMEKFTKILSGQPVSSADTSV